MRSTIAASAYLLMCLLAIAGESSLTKTFQPMDGLGAGGVVVVEVTCHDWNSHSGQPTAIGLISAKNVPPTNSDKATSDINLASASHIYFGCQDIEAAVPDLVMAADKFVAAGGYPKEAILSASLECLRRVLPAKLLNTELTFTSSPEDHDWMSKIVEKFNKADKAKPFYRSPEEEAEEAHKTSHSNRH